MRFSRLLLLILVCFMALVLFVGGNPSWAQKGKPQPPQPPADPAIAYTTFNNFGTKDLKVMNADGTNQMMALAGARDIGHHDPSWSPDGSRLVFMSNLQGSGIYIINKDGSGLCKVVEMNGTAAEGWLGPAWSPVGDKIAYSDISPQSGHADLYLVDAVCNAGVPVNLTNTPGVKEYFPTWAPEGMRLAVQAMDVDSGAPDIVVYHLTYDSMQGLRITGSTNLTEVGPLAALFVRDPSWGKQSDKIAIIARPDDWSSPYDVWVIDLADPGNPTNLTNTPAQDEYWPSWSPGDTQLVFSRSGSRKLTGGTFVVDADGTDLKRISANFFREPDWRRNPW